MGWGRVGVRVGLWWGRVGLGWGHGGKGVEGADGVGERVEGVGWGDERERGGGGEEMLYLGAQRAVAAVGKRHVVALKKKTKTRIKF